MDKGFQVTDKIAELKEQNGEVEVRLSHELVNLLSDQLYQSPYKALEETRRKFV